jgi:sulfatase modifying factor 1
MKVQKTLTVAACAALITSASASVTIDWVTVGNAGNAADPLTGYGAVAYEYKIGKYEVTNAQYGAFLNAAAQTDNYGLYNSNMSTYGVTRSGSSGSYTYSVTGALANRPVVYVSWFDAARFANWLVNGQGSGSTETGSYTLNGATSGFILANAGSQVYIPTENEWYKAAYYNAVSQTYSLYPNGQNTITAADANYVSTVSTDVGSYINDPSAYGTFDQGGNVWELNDTLILDVNNNQNHVIRGAAIVNGIFMGSSEPYLASTARSEGGIDPTTEVSNVGFRVVTGFRDESSSLPSVPSIPEPSAWVLTMLASGVMLIRRKR